MNNQNRILQIKDLVIQFSTKKGVVYAIDGISLEIDKGKVVGLVGESGCGKSLTALSILGLIPIPPGKIVRGEIRFDSRNLTQLNYRQMCPLRGKEIAMIFQEPMTSLNPVYTVGRQVGEAVKIHGNLTKNEIRKRVMDTFELVGIPEPASRFHAYPHQLSGGLRQRVMIAMALICEPKLLIADEPTTALDTTIQAQILDLLLRLRDRLATSILLITHDLGVIAEVCDVVYIMYAGKIMEKADVFTLFDHPAHPYTRGLLQSIPGMREQEKQKRLYNIKGMVPNLLHIPKGCRFHPRCEKVMALCCEQEPECFDLDDGHQVRCWLYQ